MPQLGSHTTHLRNGGNFQKDEDLAKLSSIILCCVLDTKYLESLQNFPPRMRVPGVGSFWLIQHNLWGPDAGLVSVDTGCLGSKGTTLVVHLKLAKYCVPTIINYNDFFSDYCCHHLKILSKLRTRAPTFSFCTGSPQSCSQSCLEHCQCV